MELTQKQLQYRRDLLAKIHTSAAYKKKKEAGAWDDFLYVNFEVESCANLGIGELKSLLDCLEDRIIKPVKDEDNRYYTCPNSERFAEPDDPTLELKATDKQIEAIGALWDRFDTLKPQEQELGDFIKSKIHRTHKLDRLNKTEAQKIIGVLRKIVAYCELAQTRDSAKEFYRPANNLNYRKSA